MGIFGLARGRGTPPGYLWGYPRGVSEGVSGAVMGGGGAGGRGERSYGSGGLLLWNGTARGRCYFGMVRRGRRTSYSYPYLPEKVIMGGTMPPYHLSKAL